MICIDLRGAVARRISGRSEHDVGPLVGLATGVKPLVPALLTRTRSARPSRRRCAAKIFSAIGDRQILPVHTNVTWQHVEWSGCGHREVLPSSAPTIRRETSCARAPSAGTVAPFDERRWGCPSARRRARRGHGRRPSGRRGCRRRWRRVIPSCGSECAITSAFGAASSVVACAADELEVARPGRSARGYEWRTAPTSRWRRPAGAAVAGLISTRLDALVHRVLRPPGRVVALEVRGDRPITSSSSRPSDRNVSTIGGPITGCQTSLRSAPAAPTVASACRKPP